jgi:hypothetical protein
MVHYSHLAAYAKYVMTETANSKSSTETKQGTPKFGRSSEGYIPMSSSVLDKDCLVTES